MKKKFKLFATIGSLCLAVAMMTIGVLAATSATLNVTSTVEFSATSIYATITGSVAGAATGDKTLAAVKNYDGEGAAASLTEFQGEGLTGGAWAIGALTFDEGHLTITYTFNITIDKENAAYVTITAPTAPEKMSAVATSKVGENNVTVDGKETSKVEAGTTLVYTYALTLDDVSATVAVTNINFTIALSNVAAA